LFTGNQNLGSDVNVGPGSLAVNFDSVWKCWGRGLSPAGATVLGDVLVLDVGQVVDTVHVTPVKWLWKLVSKVLKWFSNVESNVSGRLITGSIVGNSSSVCGCNEHDCDRFHE
jgi:hypothetical protein